MHEKNRPGFLLSYPVAEVEGLRARVKELEAEIDDLRRHDARKLMRCPHCGQGHVRLATRPDRKAFWYCQDHGCPGETIDDWRETPLAALLAWHEEKK